MPSTEGRHITRPRQSFSCLVCRRRKVRCGKQQPACSNCVRIRETCEYESDLQFQSKAAVHPQPKPTAAPSHANAPKAKASTQSTQEIWSTWTAQGGDVAMADHGEYCGDGSEMGDQSGQPPSNGDSSPTSSSSLHDSSVQSSARASAQTFPSSNGDPLSVHPPHVANYQSENNLRWKSPVTEGSGQMGQLSSPRALSKTAQHIPQPMAQDVSRKRPRSSNYPEQVGGSFDMTRAGPETLADGDGNAWAFMERSAFDNNRANTRITGHMSVRKGGQTRYVGPAFWAHLKGYVSSPSISLFMSAVCLQYSRKNSVRNHWANVPISPRTYRSLILIL